MEVAALIAIVISLLLGPPWQRELGNICTYSNLRVYTYYHYFCTYPYMSN